MALCRQLHWVPHLTELALTDNLVRSEGCEALIAQLPFLPYLQRVDMDSCSLNRASCIALVDALANHRWLKSLDLQSNVSGVVQTNSIKEQVKALKRAVPLSLTID